MNILSRQLRQIKKMLYKQFFHKQKYRAIIFVLPILISVFLSRGFLFSPGVITYGEFIGSTNYSKLQQQVKYAWSDDTNLGRTNLGYPETPGTGQIFGTISRAGSFYWLTGLSLLEKLVGTWTSKIYFLFALTLPFWGMYILVGYLLKKERVYSWQPAASLASFFYQVNPEILGRVTAGTLRFNICYGLLPIFLFVYFKQKERSVAPNKVLAYFTVALLILSFFIQVMPHFLVIACFIIMLDLGFALFKSDWQKTIGITKWLVLLAMAVLTTNSFLWFPPLVFPEVQASLSRQFHSLNQLIHNGQGAYWWRVIGLQPLSPEDIRKGLGHTLVNPASYVYFLLAILGTKWTGKNRLTLLTILALGFFLAKGANPPLGELNKIFYSWLPVFGGFRDPTKFLTLTVIAAAVAIGFFWQKIFTKLKREHDKFSLSLTMSISFFILAIIVSSSCFLDGRFDGIVNVVTPPEDYKKLDNRLSESLSYDSRILLLPSEISPNLGNYTWMPESNNPSVNRYLMDAVEPLSIPMSNALLTTDTWSSRFCGFFERLVTQKPSLLQTYMQKTGTEGIVLDKSFQKDSQLHELSHNLQSLLNEESFLKHTYTGQNIEIWEVKEKGSLVEISATPLLVVGNLRIYERLGQFLQEKALPPLIFLQQGDNFSKIKEQNTKYPLIFFNQDENYLLGEILCQKMCLPLGEITRHTIDATKEFISVERDLGDFVFPNGLHLSSKGAIRGEDGARLLVKTKVTKEGEYELYIKSLFSPKSGELRVLFDGKEVVFSSRRTANYNGFKWLHYPLGLLKKGKHTITLIAPQDSVVLDGVFIISQAENQLFEKQIMDFLQEREVFYIWDQEFKETIKPQTVFTVGNLRQPGSSFYYETSFEESESNWQKNTFSVENHELHGYVLTTLKEEFVSDLIYKISADAPIEITKMGWQTVFLNKNMQGRWAISQDGINWISVRENLIGENVEDETLTSGILSPNNEIWVRFTVDDKAELFGAWVKKIFFELKCANNSTSLQERYINSENLPDFLKTYIDEQEKIRVFKQSPINYSLLDTKLIKNKLLVFKTSFSPYWKLSNLSPIQVDYYANGYLVNNSLVDAKIGYEPDRLYQLTIKASTILFTMFCVASILQWTKRF